jgi:hypothetical protein
MTAAGPDLPEKAIGAGRGLRLPGPAAIRPTRGGSDQLDALV